MNRGGTTAGSGTGAGVDSLFCTVHVCILLERTLERGRAGLETYF